jgi:hypothetical protein
MSVHGRGPPELRVAEVGYLACVRRIEVRLAQLRVVEVGGVQLGPLELGLGEVGVGAVVGPDVQVVEVGAVEQRLGKPGMPKGDTLEAGVAEVGTVAGRAVLARGDHRQRRLHVRGPLAQRADTRHIGIDRCRRRGELVASPVRRSRRQR